jgi:predicted nuclease of restriction endonuclease-like RecB superfamily
MDSGTNMVETAQMLLMLMYDEIWFFKHVLNKISENNKENFVKNVYKWLDENNLSFKYEPTAIKLTNGYYTPDFWVNEWSCYVEVKGYWRDDARVKYEEAKELIDIKIIDYLWFENQGFFISKRRGICRVY